MSSKRELRSPYHPDLSPRTSNKKPKVAAKRKRKTPRLSPPLEAKDSASDQSISQVLEVVEEGNARNNIRVLVRIRPRTPKEKASKEARTIVKALDPQTIMFDQKEEMEDFFFHGVKQKDLTFIRRRNKDLTFAFDYVFSPQHSNVEIFDNSLKSIVNHVILGYNCSCFAYGATGSGKTYTMLGSSENPGLTFLMAKELSRKIKEIAHDYESEILVSYLEIYNETLKDLLSPTSTLSIREDGLNGINIPNLTKHKIQDTGELLSMLSQGNSVRTQHATDHNAESSRSHAVFQIFVELRGRITPLNPSYKMQRAKLVMVDLAGSERGSMSSSDGVRCREGANINKSLLALGNCINALADRKKHIPYRDSKLTRLLKDSLGGNCKTVMIANVSPTILNYDDTYNTLKYADRAKEIRVSCKKNIVDQTTTAQYNKMIEGLQMEVSVLKAQLQERDVTIGTLQELNSKSLKYINSSSSFAHVQKINDHKAMEEFMQVLGQKKNLEEALVEASIISKQAEFCVLWKRWRLFSFELLGKSERELQQPIIDRLGTQLEHLLSGHHQLKEKVQVSRKLVHYNNKEIELARKNFLSNLKLEDPFLTMTLAEFLHYQGLEREVQTHKSIENFHQRMCSNIFEELMHSEYVLTESFRFGSFLSKGLSDHRMTIPKRDRKYKFLISKLNEGKGFEAGKDKKADSQCMELIRGLRQVIQSPVVEYEVLGSGVAHEVSSESVLRNFVGRALGQPDSSSTSITGLVGSGSRLSVVTLQGTEAGSSNSTEVVPTKIQRSDVDFKQQDAYHETESSSASSDGSSLGSAKTDKSRSPSPEPPPRLNPFKPSASKSTNTLRPVALTCSSSSSADVLLMSLKSHVSLATLEDPPRRLPVKRTKAGVSLSPYTQYLHQPSPKPLTPRKAKVQLRVVTPVRSNRQAPPAHPPEARSPRFQIPEALKTSRVTAQPSPRAPRHVIPEPDLRSPRGQRSPGVQAVGRSPRKRKPGGSFLPKIGGGQGQGDLGLSSDQSGIHAVPNGREDSDIIAPPPNFANRDLPSRPSTYLLFKSPRTSCPFIDEEESEDEMM